MSVRKGKGLLKDIQDLKDPTVFVVLAEDTAACIGVVIAAIGLAASWLTGNPLWDAVSSIAIGGLLGVAALFLAIEVKGLLIGESTDPDVVKRVRAEIDSLPEILSINDVRSLHFGPRDVLLTLSMDFLDDVPSQRIEAIVTSLESRIRGEFPFVKQVFFEIQSRAGHESMVASDL